MNFVILWSVVMRWRQCLEDATVDFVFAFVRV
jgi:hypothetical protein